MNKQQFSIVLLEHDKDLRDLMDRRVVLGWGHPIRVKEFLDIKPLRQCLKCWSCST
jgi:hypothetical protein